MGAHVILLFHETGQEADGLDGFAQPHFICQDAIHVVVVQRHQELEAPQLVMPQGPPHKHGRSLHLRHARTHSHPWMIDRMKTQTWCKLLSVAHTLSLLDDGSMKDQTQG